MSELIDFYFLLNSRKTLAVQGVLDQFIPKFAYASQDFVVFSDSLSRNETFDSLKDAMSYLELNKDSKSSIYLKNLDKESSLKFGMIFYTNDNRVIFGVSISANRFNDPEVNLKYMSMYKSLLPDAACLTKEEPPPLNSIQFEDFCKTRIRPQLD